MTNLVSSTPTYRNRHYAVSQIDSGAMSGLDLRMSDGSLWFHPNNGAAPWQVEPATSTISKGA